MLVSWIWYLDGRYMCIIKCYACTSQMHPEIFCVVYDECFLMYISFEHAWPACHKTSPNCWGQGGRHNLLLFPWRRQSSCRPCLLRHTSVISVAFLGPMTTFLAGTYQMEYGDTRTHAL